MTNVPYCKPYLTGKELQYLTDALALPTLSGDGEFTKKCHLWLNEYSKSKNVFLTPSATAALEMCSLILETKPSDEIIMPSFTFASTANAFAIHGGIPCFIDIREDTLNINEELIEEAITPKTRAIVVVHYAGVAAEMASILKIAQKYNLLVIEDAAQCMQAYYKGQALGAIGDLGVYSFHATKNIMSGEGGCLLVNSVKDINKAEMVRDKGTDRGRFLRGDIDKYTWRSLGSSYLPSELVSAFLLAQLEKSQEITEKRISIWNSYHTALADLQASGDLKCPTIPDECQHNAHIYYVILPDQKTKMGLLNHLRQKGIQATTHFVPLHQSPMGGKFPRKSSLDVTDHAAECLLRLPLWPGMSSSELDRVISSVRSFF